jgi:hypothetical protein
MTFGERIVVAIVTEETKHAGCLVLEGFERRLLEYLDEPERERMIADASGIMGESVADLLDAFFYLLPADRPVVAVERGIAFEPLMKDIVLLS